MHPAFASICFADPARAGLNLSLVEKRLPASLYVTLPPLLGGLPDPDGALNYLERFLASGEPAAVQETLRYMARHPAALHYLLAVFSYSRFLSETLVQQPGLIIWLHKPARSRQFTHGLEHIKSQEQLSEDFSRFAAAGADLPPAVLLARFKRREYLRITVRDLLGLATLAETTLELSELADLLLDRALHFALARLQAAYGAPQVFLPNGNPAPAALTVLSLGKLGARELNYSSDIDLMFLYTGEGETTGGPEGRLTCAEFFIRLSQAVLKNISEVTSEGAAFRVDMRLRPRGTEGFLAMGIPAALEYYRTAAREWELQMLIKARPSAGDVEVGRHFLRQLHPLIFKPQFNIGAVEAVLNARAEITRSLKRRSRRTVTEPAASSWDTQWNVKLTPGGIRDIEFLSQCLQRVFGGGDPWLSAPTAGATLVALQRLHDKGHLSGRDFFQLAAAYQFLRKVEHRLQLRDGLQRHTLPDPAGSSPLALERLARRCGVEAAGGHSAGEALQRRIAQHFAEVREIYERVLVRHRPAEVVPLASFEQRSPLGEHGVLLARIHRDYPNVAAALPALPDDPLARRGMFRFLEAAVHEPPVMDVLNAQPALLACAAELFLRSDLAVDLLARQPADVHLLAPAGDAAPATAGPAPCAAPADLNDLRRSYRLGTTRVAFDSLRRRLEFSGDGNCPPAFAAFAVLSRFATQAIEHSLPLVMAGLAEPALLPCTTSLAAAPFAVLALGRLGTSEMDMGSDADLVFLADERLSPEEREPWRRLAERLIHALSSHTREGLLFPVDTRLRPRGQEGDMVQSAGYLRDYLAREAQPWEAVSWLKARPVAGNCAWARGALARAHEVLRDRWRGEKSSALRDNLRQLRLRLEKEGTGPQSRTEFKHIAGGFFDIEYVLGLQFFSCGTAFPAGGDVLAQINALASAGGLPAGHAASLARAAAFFRSMDHAHRLITGRAANRDPEPALAERIARLLTQWGFALPSSPRPLEDALASARSDTRQIYATYF
jgi:glutamate-ammonia-ligase adenylyltransferase